MAKKTLSELKGWAIPGWKPLAVQIKDWFDSFWHKDELIPISSIDGLTEVINTLNPSTLIFPYKVELSANGTYNVPVGFRVTEIVIIPTADSDTKIGSTLGGEEYMLQDTITPADPKTVYKDIIAATEEKTIYFSITATTVFLIYLKPLTPINP